MKQKSGKVIRRGSNATLRFVFAAMFILTTAVVVQAADHLKCYKVKDNGKFNAGVALTALQTQFGIADNCTVKGKAKLFCVPVEKEVLNFEGLTKDGSSVQVPFAGQDLEDDRVCYKVKCPKVEINPELITDQFGVRNVEKFKAQLLCTPAMKGAPTTTLPAFTCDNSIAPQCDGTCATGETCTDVNGTCKCEPDTPCAQSVSPQCGGTCAVGEVCFDINGTCTCKVPCESTQAPQCGGTCKVGEICFDVNGTCTCQVPCDLSPSPQCGGACANGQQCADPNGTGQCACM